ncbi:MAG: hypothetical protein ACLQKA_15715 [Bryobacteraceae bacterium]
MKFRIISETEMEDFDQILQEAGLAPEEFEVTEEAEEPQFVGIGDLLIRQGHVTVKRTKNGLSRTYKAGDDGTNWVLDFAQDLRSGAFR